MNRRGTPRLLTRRVPLRAQDRVAFATRFLDDSRLSYYLEQLREDGVARGDLSALLCAPPPTAVAHGAH